MSTQWGCKIGKVKPRLSIVRQENVEEPDWAGETGFVEKMIKIVRQHNGVNGYAFVIAHEDGTVSIGTKSMRQNSEAQLLGGLTVAATDLAEIMKAVV